MKPYKVKHVPTGLYYQPHKHGGSNLSKRGKIYQTARHGLSDAFRNHTSFKIYCAKYSLVYNLTSHILNYTESKWSWNQMVAETDIKDWIIEEI